MQYSFKTTQFGHQVETFKFLLAHPLSAVLSETGTGKTDPVVCSIDFRMAQGDVKRCLYICPETIKFEIAKEIEKRCNRKAVVLHGSSKQKLKTLKEEKGDFYVVNYDSLHAIQDSLQKKKFDAVICDESTYIKNPKSKRSRAACFIGESAKVRILITGTPVTRDVLDIFGQYKFLNKNVFGSFASFKRHYCDYAHTGGFPILIGFKNLDDLTGKIHKLAIRYKKEDCLDLPEKIFVKRPFSLSKESKAIYKELKTQAVAEINSKVFAVQNVLTKIIKLSQVCSGFLIRTPEEPITEFGTEKLTALLEFLEECNLEETKAVIWCRFKHSIKSLEKTLQAWGPQVLDGDTVDKAAVLETFRTDKKCRILIANIQTGMGYTINEASLAIYYETTYDLGQWLQSMDRNHRIGQTKKVTYAVFVAEGTVEEAMYKALKNKQDLLTYITQDNVENIFNGLVE